MTLASGVYQQSGQPDVVVPLAVDAAGRLQTTATATISSEVEIKNEAGNPIPTTRTTGQLFSNALNAVSTGAAVLTPPATIKPTIWTHSATVVGTGAVSATVVVEGSNDSGTSWFLLCTLSPTGTTLAVDAITGMCVSTSLRHRCTAIAGTSAIVTVTSSGV